MPRQWRGKSQPVTITTCFSRAAAVRARGVSGEQEITLFTCGTGESQEHDPPLSKSCCEARDRWLCWAVMCSSGCIPFQVYLQARFTGYFKNSAFLLKSALPGPDTWCFLPWVRSCGQGAREDAGARLLHVALLGQHRSELCGTWAGPGTAPRAEFSGK